MRTVEVRRKRLLSWCDHSLWLVSCFLEGGFSQL
jgi:hypothetical protein